MNCAPHDQIIYAACTAIVLGLECWLGKTQKVKASSIVELACIAVVGLVSVILSIREKVKCQ